MFHDNNERFPNAPAHYAKRQQKKRTSTGEGWVAYPRSIISSPAMRALTIHAIRVMHRLEEEHMAHGGAENGRLIVTFDQFVEWGIERKQIAPAIRELEALGLIAVTERGHAGVAGNGKANRFRLTYVNSKSRQQPTNEWSRIETMDEATRIAAAARSERDSRAVSKGNRSAKARTAKKILSSDIGTSSVPEPSTEGIKSQFRNPELHVSVPKPSTTIYISGGRSDSVGPLPAPRSSEQPDLVDAWAALSCASASPPPPLPSTVQALARYAELSVTAAKLVGYGAAPRDVLQILSGRCPMPVSLERQFRSGGPVLVIDNARRASVRGVSEAKPSVVGIADRSMDDDGDRWSSSHGWRP